MASPSSSDASSSFDAADQRASVPAVPSSSNKNKVVVLSAKVLETGKCVRTVLPEEQYLADLQKIIVKDYFPELPKLKAQKEYLDAVASNDLSKIRELQQRYSTRRTERRTSPTERRRSPLLFDAETPTPASAPGAPSAPGPSNAPEPDESQRSDTYNRIGDNEKPKKKKGKEELSVDAYLNKYTSEDNASFEELAAMHNKKERLRNAWMYDAEAKHNAELVNRGPQMLAAADEQLAVAAAPATAAARPKELDNWTYKARNSVVFHVEEVPLTVEEHIQRQKMNQRLINKEATRLPPESSTDSHQSSLPKTANSGAVMMAGKVDITGREIGAAKAPGGFGLVATPSPAPGVDESPFMTWGEIEGTPFRLDASDFSATVIDNAPAFKIPDMPVREKIAQEMTEAIAKRYRDKRKVAIRQAEKNHSRTPSFGSARSSEKLLSMSPAARRLATKGLGIRLGSDKSLRVSYTPSPSRLGASARFTPTPGSGALTRATPKRVGGAATPVKAAVSITDNLLTFVQEAPPKIAPPDVTSKAPDEIPQKKSRPSAADFF